MWQDHGQVMMDQEWSHAYQPRPERKAISRKKLRIALWVAGVGVVVLFILCLLNYQIVALGNGLSPKSEAYLDTWIENDREYRVIGDEVQGKHNKVAVLRKDGISFWRVVSQTFVDEKPKSDMIVWNSWSRGTGQKLECAYLIGYNAIAAMKEETIIEHLPEGSQVTIWQDGNYYNAMLKVPMSENSMSIYSYGISLLTELGYINGSFDPGV